MSRRPNFTDPLEALQAAQAEAGRCRRAVDNGSPREFWIKRLTDAAKRYEAAAVILRMQLAAISPPPDRSGR